MTPLEIATARVLRAAQYWRMKKKDMIGASEADQKSKRRLLHQAERALDDAVDLMDRASGI